MHGSSASQRDGQIFRVTTPLACVN